MRYIGPAFVGLIFMGFVALVIGFMSYYTVDQGEKAVITSWGRVTHVADPGLHFKNPFSDTAHTIWLRTQNIPQKTAAYSKDQQPADLEFSLTWRIDPAKAQQVYEQYRDVNGVYERLITPRVLEEIKTIFGGYTAISAVQDRGKLNADIAGAVGDALKSLVIVEGFQLTNIDFSDAYEQAVEARMTAQVEVERSGQKALNEKQLAQITVTQAQAKADSAKAAADGEAYATLTQAKAEAEAVKLKGEATAAAIKARGDALKDNPGLVALTQAERWDGKLPTTMVPEGALPMLGVK